MTPTVNASEHSDDQGVQRRRVLTSVFTALFVAVAVFLVDLRSRMSENHSLAATLENEGAEVICTWYQLDNDPTLQRVWTFIAGGAPITRVSVYGPILRGKHSTEKIFSAIETCKNIPSLVLIEIDLDAEAAKKMSHVGGMSIWIDACRISDQFIDVLEQGRFDDVVFVGNDLSFIQDRMKNGRIVRQSVDLKTKTNTIHWTPASKS